MQLRHLAERGSHRYNRILKSRQLGFTTLYCIDDLDEALWVPGMSCGILTHEQKYNSKIFAIVKRAFDNLPDEIKPVTKTNTKYAYEFVEMYDGTQLDSSIYVDTDVRSGTVLKLHITEAAWIKDSAKIDAGARQAVPKNGCISEETTANGFNDFFDKYTESEEKEHKGPIGEFDYQTYFYAWWENPEYSIPGEMPPYGPEDKVKYGDEEGDRVKYHLTDGQLLWRRWKIGELRQSGNKDGSVGLSGLQLFRQEYPASRLEAFQSGSGNVFDVTGFTGKAPLTVIQVENALRGPDYDLYEEPTKKKIEEQIAIAKGLIQLGLMIWEVPKRDGKYVIGVDPSDGEGSDFGDIDVWDKGSVTQVAQFYGKVRPDELAEIAARIGNFYNEAFIGVENNMLSCILFLVKIYSNYFFETRLDEKTAKRTKHIGWNTNNKTRDPMIDDFVMMWEDGDVHINSAGTYSEMKTFVKKDNGKREHADGKHDDRLFGAFIAVQMRKLEPKKARSFSNNPI